MNKTYNLTDGSLYAQVKDQDCFCTLGIFMAEKGVPMEVIKGQHYGPLESEALAGETLKLVKYMAEVWGLDPEGLTLEDWWTVYRVNDSSTRDRANFRTYLFGVDVIKKALAHVGIDVELNDMRS